VVWLNQCMHVCKRFYVQLFFAASFWCFNFNQTNRQRLIKLLIETFCFFFSSKHFCSRLLLDISWKIFSYGWMIHTDLMDHVMSVDVIAKTLWENENCRRSSFYRAVKNESSHVRTTLITIHQSILLKPPPSSRNIDVHTFFSFFTSLLPLCRSNHNSYFYAYLKQITRRREKNAVAIAANPTAFIKYFMMDWRWEIQ
jgi:hypothetical protein